MASKFRCKRKCYHNLRLFEENKIYDRAALGPGKVPHHFADVAEETKRKEVQDAAEEAALDAVASE